LEGRGPVAPGTAPEPYEARPLGVGGGGIGVAVGAPAVDTVFDGALTRLLESTATTATA